MMNRVAVASAVGAIIFAASAGMAGAYSVAGSSLPSGSNVSVSIPSGTFNIDWGGFLNNLPVLQPFLNSLQSAGSAAVQSVQNTQTPSLMGTGMSGLNIANGQGMLNQIDDWTQQHFGFRFSSIANVVLGLLSWVLGLAKNIVDWLIKFVSK